MHTAPDLTPARPSECRRISSTAAIEAQQPCLLPNSFTGHYL